MIKKLLFLLAAISLITNISGCTSKKAQDETEIVENAAVDKIDADAQALDNSELDSAATTPAAPSTDDASLQAALGETTPPPAVDTTTTSTDNLSLDSNTPATSTTDLTTDASTDKIASSPDIAAAPTLDESSLNDIPPPVDASAAALTETPISTDAPLVTDSAPVDTSLDNSSIAKTTTESAPLIESNMSTPKPAGSTLKKISEVTPYQSASGSWINTVYVARPKEKLKDISMKIYNADKSKELKKIAENSYLKNRSVKAGDKIYYSSPNRPDDSTKMLVYYEDVGMVPETYVAKKGDRLKKVSKEILGYDKAWVEVWSSNSVESKDKLNEGETIKYWKSASSINTADIAQSSTPDANLAANSGAAQLVDQSQMPTPPPPQPDANAALAQNDLPPPPPDMNSLPPPPPPDMNTPPPPDMNAAAPPPPPPPPDVAATAKPKKKFTPGADSAEEVSAIDGLDQDTLMSLGAIAVLTIALAFVFIRRKKKRAAEQGMSEHNVGT